MKETKVYVDELPKCCCDCICYNDHAEQCKINPKLEMSEFNYNLAYEYECYSDKERHKGCPLIDIKTHDRELVKEVCEKIKEQLGFIVDGQERISCDGSATGDKTILAVLNQIQKEFEK